MTKVVLVTGINGALGANIAKQLLLRGEKVVGLTKNNQNKGLLHLENLNQKVTFTQGDICNLDTIQNILKDHHITHIFHCAGYSTIESAHLAPLQCFQTNIMGTATVLEAARLNGNIEGILCMESDKSYGNFEFKELPYREHQALKPQGILAASKAATSYVALSYYHNYQVPVFTARASSLYGPGDFNETRLIVGSSLRLLRGESPVIYEGVANNIREFLYLEDAARIITQMMDKVSITAGKAYNVGSGYKYTVREVVDQLTKTSGFDIKPIIKPLTNKAIVISEQFLDCSRMLSLLPANITQCLGIKEGLSKTFNWYKRFSPHKDEIRNAA
jgi:nucleoside-diphosphate-sugar epimerase